MGQFDKQAGFKTIILTSLKNQSSPRFYCRAEHVSPMSLACFDNSGYDILISILSSIEKNYILHFLIVKIKDYTRTDFTYCSNSHCDKKISKDVLMGATLNTITSKQQESMHNLNNLRLCNKPLMQNSRNKHLN